MSNEATLIRNVIKETLTEMGNQNLIKKKRLTPYQKTEQVLYNYTSYVQAVNDKKEKIEEIKQYGLAGRCGSIIPMPSGSPNNATESEKAQEAIETLEKSIVLTERYIGIVDNALKSVEEDKHGLLLKMYFIEGKTIEEIAGHYRVDPATISRSKSRLVNKLSILLFSDETITELYG